ALEAMAHGVPVISSNAGGLAELNTNGYSGYMSDVGDIDAMAANALSILKERKTLDLFKKQARLQAQQFAIERVVPMYEEVYLKAINRIKQVASKAISK
ncbi:MAG: glycosyltransferase, partial [Leeuwenhoekiella sp.]|nr:glycosyltransferase [Leeuwenhoekiella sp.]